MEKILANSVDLLCQSMLGTDGMLWHIRLGITLTIFASTSGGGESVVNARRDMLEAMCGPGWCNSSVCCFACSWRMRYLRGATFSKSLVCAYHMGCIGSSYTGEQTWRTFLEPLMGKVCICCCSGRLNCHGNLFNELGVARVEQRRLYKSVFFLLVHVTSAGDTNVARFCADDDRELAHVNGELLDSCTSSVISRSISNASDWPRMWELFVGSDTLSVVFESAVWFVAPAFDISIGLAFDLLDHMFFAVISCLVLARRFVLYTSGALVFSILLERCLNGQLHLTEINEQYRKKLQCDQATLAN